VTIGILSDTHGVLRPSVLEALEGVDHLIHAGDVGLPDILVELEALAPLTAVHGNTDGFDIRARLPAEAGVELGGLRFEVTHGHTFGSPSPASLAPVHPDADVVVFGHTHLPLLEERAGRWFVNPGSCGPRRFGSPITLVLADVGSRGFQPRLIELAG
jgi:uncharacterized protein